MKSSALLGAAIVALALSGCTGPSGPASVEPDSVESGSAGSSSPATTTCGGLTTEFLVTLFGSGVTGPEEEKGQNTQNGLTWTDTGCDWKNEVADLEIDLGISMAGDFADGVVGCIEPGGVADASPVDGIGSQAWWQFGNFDEAEGTLRVCTNELMIDFEVDTAQGSMSSDEMLQKAQAAVGEIVGN